MIENKQFILQKRFAKLSKHMRALTEYKALIDQLIKHKEIYAVSVFNTLKPQERAILDAYLKRFSAIQDFLGAKIFPILLESAGVPSDTMTETLYYAVKEKLVDSLENWIELREIRNDLEHDDPEEMEQALQELKKCIDRYARIREYYHNVELFWKQHGGQHATL